MKLRTKVVIANSVGILVVLGLFGLAAKFTLDQMGVQQIDNELASQVQSILRGPGGPPPDGLIEPPSQIEPPPFGNQSQPQPGGGPPPQGFGSPNNPPFSPQNGGGQGPPPGMGNGPPPGVTRTMPHTGTVIDFASPDHMNLAKRLPLGSEYQTLTKPGQTRVVAQENDGESYRVIYFSFGPPDRVQVGRIALSLAPEVRASSNLDKAFLILIPAVLVLAFVLGSVVTKSTLAPVRLMTAQAKSIDSRQLESRINLQSQDEFGELAETLNQMLAKLEEAFAAQERALENQKRFTSDAAHELKSPLTVILGNAQLGSKNLSNEGDDAKGKVSHCLNEITRESKSMMAIVQDLLSLARLESQHVSDVETESLVSELIDASIIAATGGEGIGTVQIEPIGLSVKVDIESMVRVFRNILENAIKATVSKEDISIKAYRKDTKVVIEFIDLGVGIPPEAMSHLGERFFKADSAHTRSDSGTGLGLAICKEVLAKHEGTIAFKSKLGEGTTVTVTLREGSSSIS